ncbi:MAG: hypothetical protein JST12_20240 [Armatimonadetes bacterium]|nr:hypothetical protein [Armatimonadota bacterium]
MADNLGLSAFVLAFAATIASVIIDSVGQRSWTREDHQYGEFDLGVSAERWEHWATSSKVVFFAAIVAALVEGILIHAAGFTMALLTIGSVAGYFLILSFHNKLMKDGHEHAVERILCCADIADARRELFTEYAHNLTNELSIRNTRVAGFRSKIKSSLDDELKSEGHKLLERHSILLFSGALLAWVLFGLLLFLPEVHK